MKKEGFTLRCMVWNITPRQWVFRYRRFENTCLSHLQRNVTPWPRSNCAETCWRWSKVVGTSQPQCTQWFLLTTNLELWKAHFDSCSTLAGCLLSIRNLWSKGYHINGVDSTDSSHVVTQSATIGFLIGKHIFHSIEKTLTDWCFMTGIDGSRAAVSKTCDGFEKASVVTENIMRYY